MKSLVRLKFTDFGPFEGEREFTFNGPGTYAICAPNGAGKSHIITGAKLVTAPACRLEKPLGAYVNGLGLGADKAKVEAEFDVDGDTLVVTRTITLKKLPDEAAIHALHAEGGVPEASGKWSASFRGEKFRSNADVVELLIGLFGVENAIQEDAVFVMQNQAGQIIFETPATRSKALQYLSGAEVCQKAVDTAQRKLSNLHVVDRSTELKEKQEALRNAVGTVKELQDEYAIHEVELIPSDERGKLQGRLVRSNDAKEKLQDLPDIIWRVKEREEQRQAVLDKTAGVREQFEKLMTHLEKHADDFKGWTLLVMSSEDTERQRRQHQQVMDALATVEAEAEPNIAPVKPTTPREVIEELKQAVQKGDMLVVNAKWFLDVFEKTGRCPTCYSVPEGVEELIAANKKVVDEQGPEVVRLKARLRQLDTEWRVFDTETNAHRRWEQGWVTRLEAAIAQVEALPSLPEYDEAQVQYARLALDEYNRQNAAASVKAKQIDDCDRQVAGIDIALAGLKATLAQMEELKRNVLPMDDADSVQKLLDNDTELREYLAKVKGTLAARQEQVEELTEAIKNLEESQRLVANKVEAQAFLESIKTVMHHSAIPHDRAQVYLTQVNRVMGNYCSILHAPFTLYVDPENQYFLGKTVETVIPSYQFSGGQRTLASWAWHLAMYEKHGSQVGFLFMDEPTTGLDETNLANVGEAVRHLTSFCHGSGMQFVMVTHEEALASVFDRVITL